MSVNYVTSLKTTRMSAVIAAIDAHASPAKLEIGTTGMASILVTITLQDPSFVVDSDHIDLQGVPLSGIAGNTGTAAAARIRTGGDADIVTGLTVSTTGADINLNSTSITAGQTVTISSGVITHG